MKIYSNCALTVLTLIPSALFIEHRKLLNKHWSFTNCLHESVICCGDLCRF